MKVVTTSFGLEEKNSVIYIYVESCIILIWFEKTFNRYTRAVGVSLSFNKSVPLKGFFRIIYTYSKRCFIDYLVFIFGFKMRKFFLQSRKKIFFLRN